MDCGNLIETIDPIILASILAMYLDLRRRVNRLEDKVVNNGKEKRI